MSNTIFDQMKRHASVRHFRPDPIDSALIEEIVAAGQRASTSSNLQTYSVIAVQDRAKREVLAELCGHQDQIRQAPLFLAWCADLSRLDRVCQRRGYVQNSDYLESFLVSAVDAALAMQNASLAAESLGLGMCYIGAIRNHPRNVIDLLKLPRLVFPISGMTVGWPAWEHRVRPRLPIRAVLHWETYDPTGEEEAIAEYDQAMIATGIYAGRQVPVRKGQLAEEEYGWSEHSARRVSKAIRTELGQILAEQGFMLK